jgi:hypothetical protein
MLGAMLKLLRASNLLALLAAIMLVVGGLPARAALAPCAPCPPDCPMMKQMASAMDHHAQAPARGGKPDNPCKQDLLCQAAATATPAILHETGIRFLASATEVLKPMRPLPATSRPPDPGLRPPIQL